MAAFAVFRRVRGPVPIRRWILWTGTLALVTTTLFAARASLDKAHIALIYVLVVLGASAQAGRRVGMSVALGSFLLFNFLFVRPYYTFAVTHAADWMVLAVFLITSATAAHLLSRAQSEAEAARDRAAEIDRLSALGAEALNVPRPEDALTAIAEVIRSTLSVERTEIFIAGEGTIQVIALAGHGGDTVDSAYLAGEQLVEWVARSGQAVVERTDAAPRVIDTSVTPADRLGVGMRDARALLLPLSVQGRTVGVLRVTDRERLQLDIAQERFLMALAYYAALGVERVRLIDEARHAQILRESDRTKDALLASVSHDLRTPLTTIKALAQEIRLEGDDRAAIIEEEADRLNRFVTDLLDLSQLAAGGLTLKPEMYAIDDLLGAALQRVGGRLGGRTINASLSSDSPLLVGHFDFSHSLRALVNLIENALKYSPPSIPVDVSATRVGEMVEIAVADRGPGVPPADQSRIFQPFHRSRDHADGGVGLGLSIARGLAVAQGGGIDYTPRSDGGSVFTLRLRAADASEPPEAN